MCGFMPAASEFGIEVVTPGTVLKWIETVSKSTYPLKPPASIKKAVAELAARQRCGLIWRRALMRRHRPRAPQPDAAPAVPDRHRVGTCGIFLGRIYAKQ